MSKLNVLDICAGFYITVFLTGMMMFQLAPGIPSLKRTEHGKKGRLVTLLLDPEHEEESFEWLLSQFASPADFVHLIILQRHPLVYRRPISFDRTNYNHVGLRIYQTRHLGLERGEPDGAVWAN